MVIKPLDEFEQWFRINGRWWVDDADTDNLIIYVQGDAKLKYPVILIPDCVRIPYTFGEVSGNFDCHGAQVQDLTGSPRKVGGNFDAGWNPITSLAGGPTWVGGDYHVQECANLTDISDVADHVGGEFEVAWNKQLKLLKAFVNCHSVKLNRPTPYSTWDDIRDVQQIQKILNDHAGDGRAGLIHVAAALIKLQFPENARW